MSIRALGKPLGNALALPRVDAFFTRITFSRIVSGSGVLQPPKGAVAMRVAVIGGGGGGAVGQNTSLTDRYRVCGGGGGGCAATNIIPSSAITYFIGAGGGGVNSPTLANTAANAVVAPKGGNTTATVNGVDIIARGGFGGSIKSFVSFVAGGSTNANALVAYSRTGGSAFVAISSGPTDNAGRSGGGGGAGPAGNGGAGGYGTRVGSVTVAPTSGEFVSSAWGVGGGSGGVGALTQPIGATGGAGTGALAGIATFNSIFGGNNVLATIWGRGSLQSNNVSQTSAGGQMGGGGAAYYGGSASDASRSFASAGGSGGMVVEYFFTD